MDNSQQSLCLGALKQAINLTGSQVKLAKAVGVRQGTVSKWVSRTRGVPERYVFAVETATGGKITRHELRPDIFPYNKSH